MLPARILLHVQQGETVLDLCAAPGGKSTQLASAMRGQGTLVCNEPRTLARAAALSGNLERMGVRNALVVSAESRNGWHSDGRRLFDAILVDAPCSGEGMFRKPPRRHAWNGMPNAPCALCQAPAACILESAAAGC